MGTSFHSSLGFVLQATRDRDARHQLGGRNPHEKARCYTCRRPLLLLWTLDLEDPLLGPLQLRIPGGRLAVFYCWGCVPAQIAWRVEASGSVVSLNDGKVLSYASDPDAPRPLYPGYPEFFPERRARLVRLTAAEQAAIHGANAGGDAGDLAPKHQVGGEPYLVQGADVDRDEACPLCGAWMALLATVANETGSEGEGFAGDDFVQVLVSWCAKCSVFASWNECD